MRGALGRAALFFFAVMMCSFVYYGLRLETIWRFLEWRFALVFGAFTAVITALLFAPSLFDAALARSRALAAALALAASAGIFLLMTEVTGTDLQMAYNVSPWPFITLVGFLFLGALIASLHLASGAASVAAGAIRTRRRDRAGTRHGGDRRLARRPQRVRRARAARPHRAARDGRDRRAASSAPAATPTAVRIAASCGSSSARSCSPRSSARTPRRTPCSGARATSRR